MHARRCPGGGGGPRRRCVPEPMPHRRGHRRARTAPRPSGRRTRRTRRSRCASFAEKYERASVMVSRYAGTDAASVPRCSQLTPDSCRCARKPDAPAPTPRGCLAGASDGVGPLGAVLLLAVARLLRAVVGDDHVRGANGGLASCDRRRSACAGHPARRRARARPGARHALRSRCAPARGAGARPRRRARTA